MPDELDQRFARVIVQDLHDRLGAVFQLGSHVNVVHLSSVRIYWCSTERWLEGNYDTWPEVCGKDDGISRKGDGQLPKEDVPCPKDDGSREP